MSFQVYASCGCNVGKIRKKNEDNFIFWGKHLKEHNPGLTAPLFMQDSLENGFCLAVFDGIGGENFGEKASYVAANKIQSIKNERSNNDIVLYLNEMTKRLDEIVVEAQQNMHTDKMGTTMVCMYYFERKIYFCNIGDSRAYRLRNGKIIQLSYDHISKRPSESNKKGWLTQYLGYGSEGIEVEPFVCEEEIKRDDIYLLCSDGLSDMLTDLEICDIIKHSENPKKSVEKLIDSAMEHGGRDNITVIVCKVV